MRRHVLVVLAGVSFASVITTAFERLPADPPAPEDRLRVDLPYQARRSDPITHEVDFRVVVTPPEHTKVLKVWLPLPQSDMAQEIRDGQLSTFPLEVEPQVNVEPVYGNQIAYFEFHGPKGAQIIRHRFTAKVWNLDWDLDADKVADVTRWPREFEAYLEPEDIAQRREFDRVLSEIAGPPGRGANDLLNAMQWIDANLTYDHAQASLRADADHAFRLRRGHCSDYHGLCATMGRSLGYPARLTYGLALYPKNSPSHCKMEAFLPPYGWVSFDLSETQKLVGAIYENASLSPERKKALAAAARERLHGGFRENSWLLLTKGTNYELVPKASQPVDVVRTIYAEADGQPLPEPDPANPEMREFSWMTAHRFTSDKPFKLPLKDVTTLESE